MKPSRSLHHLFSPTHPFLPYGTPHFSHISHFNLVFIPNTPFPHMWRPHFDPISPTCPKSNSLFSQLLSRGWHPEHTPFPHMWRLPFLPRARAEACVCTHCHCIVTGTTGGAFFFGRRLSPFGLCPRRCVSFEK